MTRRQVVRPFVEGFAHAVHSSFVAAECDKSSTTLQAEPSARILDGTMAGAEATDQESSRGDTHANSKSGGHVETRGNV